ncbi:MAG TPA: hypothetical protein VFU89_06720 [Rhabdochlamydiaceae bacterium]|nr:hypothetical protein [Rhabdochlamydiaceae bacterium]
MGAIHHLLHPLTYHNGTTIGGEQLYELFGVAIAQFVIASSFCWIYSCSFTQCALYTSVLTVITFYTITALFKINVYLEDRINQLDTVLRPLESDASSTGGIATDSQSQPTSSSAITKTSDATSIYPTSGQEQLRQQQVKAQNRNARVVAGQVIQPQSHTPSQPAPGKKVQEESFGDIAAGVWTTLVGPSHTKAISDQPPDWIISDPTDSYAMKFQRAYFVSLWKSLKGNILARLDHMTRFEAQDHLLKTGELKIISGAPWAKFAEQARTILQANS